MSSIPRPLIAVLGVAVVFFALWTVALKRTLTGGGGSQGGTPAYQSAVNQARGLQAQVNAAAARAGGTPRQSAQPQSPPDQSAPAQSTTATPSTSSATTSTPTATAPTTPLAKHHSSSGRPAAGHAAAAGHAGATAGGTSTIASAASGSHPLAPVSPAPRAHPTGIALVSRALDQHKVLALLFYNPAAADDRAVSKEMSVIPTQGGKVVKVAVPVQDLGVYSSLLNEVPVNFSPTLVVINRDRQAEEIAGFADSFEIAQRVAAALGTKPPAH